ncbi:MAG: glycosyltransferase [Oscillospiraceae bacterium]|nr:glycosyltransferase [Oscillospiraceae bacterium]
MAKPIFTVIIPAHNEEKYIGGCLEAVRKAASHAPEGSVQVIVVANRCTDRTAEIALSYGAQVIPNEDKHISRIRNAGAARAMGRIIVTIDADSKMSENSFIEIHKMLKSGLYVGGGTVSQFDRMSPGIAVSAAYVAMNIIPVMIREKAPLMGGMFWCLKKDFDAVGGFDESLVSVEDLDFAVRLKRHGEKTGRRYGVLPNARIITSSRKFDEFGDWYLVKNRKLTKEIFTGTNREAADKFYYDVR